MFGSVVLGAVAAGGDVVGGSLPLEVLFYFPNIVILMGDVGSLWVWVTHASKDVSPRDAFVSSPLFNTYTCITSSENAPGQSEGYGENSVVCRMICRKGVMFSRRPSTWLGSCMRCFRSRSSSFYLDGESCHVQCTLQEPPFGSACGNR